MGINFEDDTKRVFHIAHFEGFFIGIIFSVYLLQQLFSRLGFRYLDPKCKNEKAGIEGIKFRGFFNSVRETKFFNAYSI